MLADSPDREISTTAIGELLMERLADARQDRLCAFCLGVSGFPGCGGISGGIEGPASAPGLTKPWLARPQVETCNQRHPETSFEIET